MSDAAAFEAAVLADTGNDRAPYAVYGDLLVSQGDPRGELIALQLLLADHPHDSRARERETELLRVHRRAWLGDLAPLRAHDLGITWRHGFVHGVRFGAAPGTAWASELEIAPALAALHRIPHARLVREVTIGPIDHDDYMISWAPAVAAIAAHGLPPNVTSLVCSRGTRSIEDTMLGDLSPAYPALANLRDLGLELGSLDLGDFDLPALRRFAAVTCSLTAANLRSLTAAPRAHLEHLVLYLGESQIADPDAYRRQCDIALLDLAPILDGENLPAVRHLALASTSLTDDIAQALPRANLLGRLESLDLSGGTLTDAGAQALLAAAPRFAHLRALDLGHAYLSDEVRAELARVFPQATLGDPQSPDDDFRHVVLRA